MVEENIFDFNPDNHCYSVLSVLTFVMSRDPLVSVCISSMSKGSNILLSFVQVMNWKGG